MPANTSKTAGRYRVTTRALEWSLPDGTARRAEVGAVVDDLPPDSIPGLLADGLISADFAVGPGELIVTPGPEESVI